jgi:hypothetical protein
MAAVMEVKVPDIGDFKDVPVIEVMSHASHISGARCLPTRRAGNILCCPILGGLHHQYTRT